MKFVRVWSKDNGEKEDEDEDAVSAKKKDIKRRCYTKGESYI